MLKKRREVLAGDDKLLTKCAKSIKSAASSKPKVLSSWTRVLLDGLIAEGHDGVAIAAKAGFSIRDFDDPNGRFKLDQTSKFWRFAVEDTGDDAIGIWISKHVRHTTFHALGLAVAASRNWYEALSRMARYSEVVSDSEKIIVSIQENHWEYILSPGAETYRASCESLDAIMSHMLRTSRARVEGFKAPLSVELARPKPRNHSTFSDFFGCPIQYDAKINRMLLPLELMHAPLSTANISLAEQGDHIVQSYLKQVASDPLDGKLRQAIVDALPSGNISIHIIARDAGMSVRSLQRYFSDIGGTFSEFASEIRAALAQDYLSQNVLPMTEVAFLLGYSNPASFSRAFKIWTGQTPTQYQREN
jgi:AraC-like DNA-binding protein